MESPQEAKHLGFCNAWIPVWVTALVGPESGNRVQLQRPPNR